MKKGEASRFPFPLKPGAGDESRTRDLNLGKVALYQLSYSRVLSKRMRILQVLKILSSLKTQKFCVFLRVFRCRLCFLFSFQREGRFFFFFSPEGASRGDFSGSEARNRTTAALGKNPDAVCPSNLDVGQCFSLSAGADLLKPRLGSFM